MESALHRRQRLGVAPAAALRQLMRSPSGPGSRMQLPIPTRGRQPPPLVAEPMLPPLVLPPPVTVVGGGGGVGGWGENGRRRPE